MIRSLAVPAALLALAACEVAPSHVEVPDIQEAMALERYKTVCVGLDMKDDDTRKFAAEQLIDVKDPIAQECICSHVADERKDWDRAVAQGIKTTDRDDIASCFAELVKKPELKKRLEAVGLMASMSAPVARTTLADIAAEAGADTEVRVRAMQAVAGDTQFKARFLEMAKGEKDVTVRAAATDALGGMTDDDVIAALKTIAVEDEAGEVRGSALSAIRRSKVGDSTEMMCTAMMNDDSPIVRTQAIAAFRGTKRDEAIACLKERALTLEEDSGVRQKLLSVLKSSPSDKAALVLCDSISFWAKSYLKKGMPDKVPGTDIIRVQNDRDYERSYQCVQTALRRSSGYSCYARAYVGNWMRELGGSASVPQCPGYTYE